MASVPMYAAQTVSGNQPRMRRLPEEGASGAGAQTFLQGTPVQVDTDGGIAAWNGTTVANGIAGIAKEYGHSLTTTGVGKTLSYGSVNNQPLAVNIPEGAPANDGTIAVEPGVSDSIFYGQVGPSQTTAATDLYAKYGMTQDSDGHWYVDKTKTGANAVVQIVKIDTIDTVRGVYFVFLASALQALA